MQQAAAAAKCRLCLACSEERERKKGKGLLAEMAERSSHPAAGGSYRARSPSAREAGESITHALDEAFDMIIQTQTIRTGSLADRVDQQADEIHTLKAQVADLLFIVKKQSVAQQQAETEHRKTLQKRALMFFSKSTYMMAFDAFKLNWQGAKEVAALQKAAEAEELEASKQASVEANAKKLAELEQALLKETQQRHYEVAQIEEVLQLHMGHIQGQKFAEEKAREAEIEKKLRQMVNRMRNRDRAAPWYAWVGFVKAKKAKEAMGRKALGRITNLGLGFAFTSWLEKVRQAHAQKIKQRESRTSDLLGEVAKAVSRVGEVEQELSKETQQRHTEVELINSVVQRLEEMVVGHGSDLTKVEENLGRRHKMTQRRLAGEIVFRLQHNVIGSVFSSWRGAVNKAREAAAKAELQEVMRAEHQAAQEGHATNFVELRGKHEDLQGQVTQVMEDLETKMDEVMTWQSSATRFFTEFGHREMERMGHTPGRHHE